MIDCDCKEWNVMECNVIRNEARQQKTTKIISIDKFDRREIKSLTGYTILSTILTYFDCPMKAILQ